MMCLLTAVACLSFGSLTAATTLEPDTQTSYPDYFETAEAPVAYRWFREGAVFGLKTDDFTYCLLAEFQGRLVIRKIGNWMVDSSPEGKIINIPPYATVNGHCSVGRTSSAELELIWFEDEITYRLILTFGTEQWLNTIKNTLEWQWKMSKVVLKIIPAPTLEKANKTVLAISTTSGIRAPMMQSFFCKHSVKVNLVPVDNSSLPFDVQLQFAAPMTLQAYNVQNMGGFGNKFLCQRSRDISILERLRNQATIGTGCVLGITCIGVILGHAAKRQYFPGRMEYSTMK